MGNYSNQEMQTSQSSEPSLSVWRKPKYAVHDISTGRGAFNLGKLFGIQFRVHVSWFIIFILVASYLVYPNYTHWFYWVTGIVASLLLFASVVAHELAHSLVGRANGIPIESITLFIFGGVALMTKEAARPGAEFKMAVAGPVCSLLLGVCFGLLLYIPGIHAPIFDMILGLAITNLMLAAFNLVPGFPLDGGRIFRSFIWRVTGSYKRASQMAIRLGQGIGYLLILGGILIIFFHPSFTIQSIRFELIWFDGLWMAFIGWFLLSAASASYRQIIKQEVISGLGSLEVMPSNRPAVPPDTVN